MPARQRRAAAHRRRVAQAALLWAGASSPGWALPSPNGPSTDIAAPEMPLAVSLLQPQGPVVQLRVRAPEGVALDFDWDGAGRPPPHRLTLSWKGVAATLDRSLPRLPAGGIGPLQALAFDTSTDSSRLELQLGWSVRPHLRRVGDSWVLRLEPLAPQFISAETSRGPAQPSTPPPLPAPREFLLVDLTVNGRRLADVVRTEQAANGPLLVPRDAWTEARLKPLAQSASLSDGSAGYPLDEVPGARYRIDRAGLAIDVTAPAEAFVGARYGQDVRGPPVPLPPQPGVMLNYDVSVAEQAHRASGGATLEALAFGRYGSFVNSALVSGSGGTSRAVRLDSYWRYDLPGRMESLQVGDIVGAAGGWSQPARFAGIRWGRDFSLRPGFVTLPQVSLSGQAALPSTVEVLVNNARRLSQPVQPGPFDLGNTPIVNGAGEIGLVVRDLLGRETVVRQGYYASPRLLAPGLSDFSFEAGALRTGYGGPDSRYGSPFAAAAWRQGVTNSVTADARIEAQARRQAVGGEVAGLLGDWAVARASLAHSEGDLQASAPGDAPGRRRGNQLQAAIERSAASLSGSLQVQHADRDFAPFGEPTGPRARSQRAREQWLANVSGPLGAGVSAGVSVVEQQRWDGERVRLAGASLTLPLGDRSILSVSANKTFGAQGGMSVSTLLTLPLDGGVNSVAQARRDVRGHWDADATAMRNPSSNGDLGWRVQAGSDAEQRAAASLLHNGSHAQLGLDVVANARGQLATRAGARGTLGLVDGLPFASAPVGNTSVAVVKVGDLADVPIRRSNQVVAHTNAQGLAVVPGLLPWQQNLIEIDPTDLPLDVDLSDSALQVTPYARSAVAVEFAARRSRQAVLELRQRDGEPVPLGATLRMLPDGREFVAGKRGKVWLTDMPEPTQRVQVGWPSGGCTLQLTLPPSVDGLPADLGTLVCDGDML